VSGLLLAFGAGVVVGAVAVLLYAALWVSAGRRERRDADRF